MTNLIADKIYDEAHSFLNKAEELLSAFVAFKKECASAPAAVNHNLLEAEAAIIAFKECMVDVISIAEFEEDEDDA